MASSEDDLSQQRGIEAGSQEQKNRQREQAEGPLLLALFGGLPLRLFLIVPSRAQLLSIVHTAPAERAKEIDFTFHRFHRKFAFGASCFLD